MRQHMDLELAVQAVRQLQRDQDAELRWLVDAQLGDIGSPALGDFYEAPANPAARQNLIETIYQCGLRDADFVLRMRRLVAPDPLPASRGPVGGPSTVPDGPIVRLVIGVVLAVAGLLLHDRGVVAWLVFAVGILVVVEAAVRLIRHIVFRRSRSA